MLEVSEFIWGDIGVLYDGPHATPHRLDEGPYFLNIASLKSGRLDLSESDHVSPKDFAMWTRRVTPRADDLLFSYETRLGQAALMPGGVDACLGRRMALLRPNLDIVDPKFLLYFYLGPEWQSTIQERAIHGATVDRIGLATMSSWPLTLPKLETQRGIAEVLGALDDKIAANTVLADCAFAMAKGHFQTALKNGAELKPIASVGRTALGGTPSRANPELWANGTIPWLASGKANERQILRPTAWITETGLGESSARMMPSGTTVLALTGATLGQIARLEIPACANQQLMGVWNEDPEVNDWLFFAISQSMPDLLRHATGAAQQHVNKRTVEALLVPMAPAEIVAIVGRRVRPLLDLAASVNRASAQLAATRDELLPLLMSGQITVRDVESMV